MGQRVSADLMGVRGDDYILDASRFDQRPAAIDHLKLYAMGIAMQKVQLPDSMIGNERRD